MAIRRVAVLFVGILVLGLAPTLVSAQGTFGMGLPGFPSFSGLLGERLGCGQEKTAFSSLKFYVGWGDDRIGNRFGESAADLPLGGTSDPRNWRHPNRGLWLGLADQLQFTERIGVLVSGWYLIPSNRNGEEQVTSSGFVRKTWETKNRWYWLEAALNVDVGMGSVVGGFRYDYNTASFKDPFNIVSLNQSDTPEADFTFENFIPFFGIQYSCANLTARVIGFPALFGTARYGETNLAFANPAIFSRIEGTGTYKNGYFFEAFLEYSRAVFGTGQIGAFGRYTAIHSQSTTDFEGALAGIIPPTASTNLFLDRQNWTVGGSLRLDFSLPM
ncbi:MAG: hypothetical protein HY913_10785 [Desulfomonile tiedjei]|nr:hypothetical protein [Desulfomonile tiedjei]